VRAVNGPSAGCALASRQERDYHEGILGRHAPAAAPDRLARVPHMNQKSPASPPTTSAVPLAPPIRQPLDPRAMAAALAGIRTVSQRESDTYLHDTVVPHGGE